MHSIESLDEHILNGGRGHPWYSGSALDCWSTGPAIDPVAAACFITKFISLAQFVPGPV